MSNSRRTKKWDEVVRTTRVVVDRETTSLRPWLPLLPTSLLLFRQPPIRAITTTAESVLGLGRLVVRSVAIRSPLLPRRSASSSRSDRQRFLHDWEDADQVFGSTMRFSGF
jgi:hypothetical protein